MAKRALAAEAAALWPDLAAAAGLPTGGWRMRVLAGREDARVARILLRFDRGGERLVLKHEARPRRPEAFAAAIEAHRDAAASFPAAPGLGIPALRAEDAARQAALYDFAPGRPLSEALAAADPEAQAALLERAGRWVAAFHRGRLDTRRTFRPHFTTRYLRRIRDEIASGARRVAEPARFDAAAATLLAEAHRWDGQETVAARMHGDLHLRNLLVGDSVWGIDFAPGGGPVPVGHDLARLLVDYAALHAPHDAVAPGEVLPGRAAEAFFAGYDLVGADDPSVGLLLRHRILADWWGLPATAEERSLAQGRRLAGLLSLAGRCFGV